MNDDRCCARSMRWCNGNKKHKPKYSWSLRKRLRKGWAR